MKTNETFTIGGVSCQALADALGTPLYIYDEERIQQQLDLYKDHFVSDRFDTKVIYASKAFLCGAVLSLLKEETFCLDVVSGGELHCAKKNGFPMDRV